MAAYFGAVALAIVDLARGAARFDIAQPAGAIVLGARLLAVLLAAFVAARLAGLRVSGDAGLATVRRSLLARLLLYAPFVGIATTTVMTASNAIAPDDSRLVAIFASGALAGCGAALLAATRLVHDVPMRRSIALLDLIACNAMIALVAAEVAVRLFQRADPTQLLWRDTGEAGSLLELRQCPEPWLFRYRCNERGYPDEEFADPAPGDYAVALIADSFGVGMVPWPYHFATLAERELRARLSDRYPHVAIDNFGVSAIDLPEYRLLIQAEIRGRAYDQVVLCLFIGNDLGDVGAPTDGPLRRLVRLQGWLAPEVARRAWLVAHGTAPPNATDPEDLPDEPDFLHDAALEPPTFAPAAYLDIEVEHVRYALPRAPASKLVYRQAFESLDAIHAELGSRLLVVLIPDEFQVNDTLWDQVLPLAAKTYARSKSPSAGSAVIKRDYPQRRIAEWAADRGVRLLDLLPSLREAEREGRTYHLRDSHWNAHGNRVAARELASALLRDEIPAR